MSADNYLLIRKEDTDWAAYMECASIEKPSYTSKIFNTDSIENAVIGAQDIYTEYGYRFEVAGVYNNDNSLN